MLGQDLNSPMTASCQSCFPVHTSPTILPFKNHTVNITDRITKRTGTFIGNTNVQRVSLEQV